MRKSIRSLTSHDAVLQALALHDELGADEFLARHGFGRSYRYQLVLRGRDYHSKAVAGVAFGFQYPWHGPLQSKDFSGGASGAAYVLRRLGFDIRNIVSRPTGAPIRLVGCVKSKRSGPAPARDLYTSDLFRKRRAYVESFGDRWFILSAQHGLVLPEDVLEPYDMALKEQPVHYRTHWGRRVVEALVGRLGCVKGRRFEVHAGAAYVNALRQPLDAAGGSLLLPLAGLTQGKQLSWYLQRSAAPAPAPALPALREVEAAVEALNDPNTLRSARGFPWGRSDLSAPGLYAWHVDAEGANHLSRGLGAEVPAGLIYAGQAGATTWPSCTRHSSTLLSRIRGSHLGGNVSASTWRLSLSAVLSAHLAPATSDVGLAALPKDVLTEWMREHLWLNVHPFHDRDGLGGLERAMLARLDPPLNLSGMTRTPVRGSLSVRRRAIAGSRPDRVHTKGGL
ncbi:hypothetical protein BH23VER1_BH23VER1_27080 [soil metagenome]